MVRGRAETVEGTVWCCIKTCMQCAAGWVRASVCLEVEAMAPVYCQRAGGLAAVGATGEKGGPMSKNGLETTTHCPALELGHGNVFGGPLRWRPAEGKADVWLLPGQPLHPGFTSQPPPQALLDLRSVSVCLHQCLDIYRSASTDPPRHVFRHELKKAWVPVSMPFPQPYLELVLT